MKRPRTWMRFFSYAVIGVATGYLLFAFTDLETKVAVLFGCAVVGLISWHFRGRDNAAREPLVVKERDGADGTYGKFLQERWNEDLVLPSSVTGVRGMSASSDNWGAPEVDPRGGSAEDVNRD